MGACAEEQVMAREDAFQAGRLVVCAGIVTRTVLLFLPANPAMPSDEPGVRNGQCVAIEVYKQATSQLIYCALLRRS